jgi:hypothetical protein
MSTVQFLTRREAADLMGIAAKTLSNWAVRGYGPQAYNPSGGKALYDRNEIIAFVKGTSIVSQPAVPKRGRGRPSKQANRRTG